MYESNHYFTGSTESLRLTRSDSFRRILPDWGIVVAKTQLAVVVFPRVKWKMSHVVHQAEAQQRGLVKKYLIREH